MDEKDIATTTVEGGQGEAVQEQTPAANESIVNEPPVADNAAAVEGDKSIENPELEQGKNESDEQYFSRLEQIVKAEHEAGQDGKPDATANPKQKPVQDAKPKKTLIPQALMDKFKIPPKFKYFEDVLAWGANAENQMKKEGQRRAELEKLIQRQQQQQSPTQSNPTMEATADDPQFQEAIENFKLELEINPAEAMGKLYSEFSRLSAEGGGRERQEAIAQANAQAKADMDELSKGMTSEQLYSYIDELKTIAAEHPNISNIKVIDKLLKYKKLEQAQKLDKEQAAKIKAKTAGSFPSSASKLTESQDLESKLRNAETMEELEQYGKQLFAQ
jgi:hypothetical protein